MEVGQGPNWGCSTKGKKYGVTSENKTFNRPIYIQGITARYTFPALYMTALDKPKCSQLLYIIFIKCIKYIFNLGGIFVYAHISIPKVFNACRVLC
jgi:hypothetical protein